MSELSGRPNVLKRLNSDLIKDSLRNLGSATKAELAKETGISLTTVGLILTSLVNEGEVLNQGYDESSGGRRAERYTLNLSHSLAAALCVDDTFIDYAIGNTAGELLEDGRVEILEHRHMEAVESLLDYLTGKYSTIRCIGLGVPSAVDNGRLFTGTKLKHWFNFNVQAHLEQKYNLPVTLENDLNAIATGFAYNRLKEAGLVSSSSLNMIYVLFTTDGTGSGIIANGKLVRGFSKFAGEIGFLQIGSGKTMDDIVYKEHTADEYADAVALTIASVNCIVNPEYVVIGGETFEFDKLELINEYCSRYIPENVRPEIIPADNCRMDYISGVMHITLEEMNSGIKLIKTKKL